MARNAASPTHLDLVVPRTCSTIRCAIVFRRVVLASTFQVLMAKLAFMLVFEHCVFVLKALIQYIIPDVPGGLFPLICISNLFSSVVQVAIKRQEYQAEQALVSEYNDALRLQQQPGNKTPKSRPPSFSSRPQSIAETAFATSIAPKKPQQVPIIF